jgi:hypothetical protein
MCNGEQKPTLQFMVVDKYNQKIEVIKISETARSYIETEALLNNFGNHHP